MAVFIVPDDAAGDRVDAVAARLTGIARSRIENWAEAGAVLLDGRVVPKSARVRGGELLELPADAPVRNLTIMPAVVEGMGIVHDDPDIVVVDKPPWVAAHPSFGWDGPDVLGHLAAAGFRISTSGPPERRGIVQRLDVGTSGLMVVAKSEAAYTVLKQAFRDRAVDKTYHALAQGHPDPSRGTIDAPIGHHKGGEWKMAVVAGGRPSVTHYATLEAHPHATLLEVHLETGRTHQIRVHLAAVRHPCAGDLLYGADPVLAGRLGLSRQWLHAYALAFTHPTTGEPVSYVSPYPDDLETALARIRDGV